MEFPVIHKVLAEGYSVVGDDGTQIDFADDGTMRKRILFPETQYEIIFQTLVKGGEAVLNLRQFYNSYKYETIDWTDPFTLQLYKVSMTAEPRLLRTNAQYAWLEIRMQGVASND